MGTNLDTMKRFIAAWQQNWEAACRDFISEDFECVEPPGLPQSGIFRGWDAPIRISNIYRSVWDVEVLDYRFWDQDGSGVVVSRYLMKWRSKATGRSMTQPVIELNHIRDGRITKTGIGRATAELFAAEGASVVIAARREHKLREVSATAPDFISHVQMDLANATDRRRALDFVLSRHGRLDALINNAANQLWKPFLEQTEDEIDAVIDTNLISTAKLIHAAVPHLRRTSGCVVNVSSTAARYSPMPSQNLTTYSASKAGLNVLTRTLAAELGPLGIRVNAVAPGLTYGEQASVTLDRTELHPMLTGMTALRRIGQPIDVARVVLFMTSPQAAWVTGQVLDASGGWQIAAG